MQEHNSDSTRRMESIVGHDSRQHGGTRQTVAAARGDDFRDRGNPRIRTCWGKEKPVLGPVLDLGLAAAAAAGNADDRCTAERMQNRPDQRARKTRRRRMRLPWQRRSGCRQTAAAAAAAGAVAGQLGPGLASLT